MRTKRWAIALAVCAVCASIVSAQAPRDRTLDFLRPTDNPSVNVARISKMLELEGSALLGPGDWPIDRSLAITKDKLEVRGVGRATKIRPTGDFAAFELGPGNDWCGLHSMMIIGGKHGVKMHDSNRCRFSNLFIYGPSSHGFYVERTLWICSLTNVDIIRCGGDGLRSVGGDHVVDGLTHPATGNALSLVNCNIEHNRGSGVVWCATGLNLNGCCIEGNGGPGLQITAHEGSARSINVSGNYFESNGHSQREKGEIHLSSIGNYRIAFMEVAGNNFSTRRIGDDGTGGVIISCDTERERRVMRLCWRQSNTYGSRGVPLFRFGRSLVLSRLEHVPDELTDMPYDAWGVNTVESSRRQSVQTHTFLVSCNQDRIDQEVTLLTLADSAVVHNIAVDEYEAPDGEAFAFDAEQAGNKIIATWTNTGGEVTKGKYRVRVTYSPASGWEQDIPVPVLVPIEESADVGVGK